MASTITTTGTTTDPISTTHVNGESVSTWVSRHDDAVAAATPSGTKLTTKWKSTSGEKSVTTTRQAGESDTEFKLRHINDYVTMMIDFPPAP